MMLTLGGPSPLVGGSCDAQLPATWSQERLAPPSGGGERSFGIFLLFEHANAQKVQKVMLLGITFCAK